MPFKNNKMIFLLVLYSFLICLFCLGGSPFINNMISDGSVFYVIGKGILNGKVVYKDLWDHKGLYLFFINFFAAGLNRILPFPIGLYLIQTTFFFFSLLFVYKTAGLFISRNANKFLASAAFGIIYLNYFSFQAGGNSVEEYTVLFQLISIYLITKHFAANQDYKFPEMFIHGVCSGIVLFIRPNMVAMWIPFGVVFVVELLKKKKVKALCYSILFLVLGIIAAFIPVLVYCLINECFDEMIFATFIFNFTYASGRKMNILGIIKPPVFTVIILAMISGLVLLKNKSKNLFAVKWIFVLAFFISFVFIFISGRTFGHYYHYFVPFTLPLIISVIYLLSKKVQLNKIKFIFYIIIIFFVTVCVNLRAPIEFLLENEAKPYREFMNQIAVLVNESKTESPRAIATGNNAQFYNAIGYSPEIRYFHQLGISYGEFPDSADLQISSVLSGENDFILLNWNGKDNGIILGDGKHDGQIKIILDEYYNLITVNEQFNLRFYEKHLK